MKTMNDPLFYEENSEFSNGTYELALQKQSWIIMFLLD